MVNDTAVAEKEKTFSLPNEKVFVKPILRSGRWLPEGHSGAFMYDNTSMGIMVPKDRNTGRLRNPLTKEEQKFFETEAGLDLKEGDLNPYKKKGNFWFDFNVRVRKGESIVNDKTILMTLDLSQPMDYLQYKVLMSNTQPDGGLIAPSWEQRFASGTYRIALVREGQQYIDKARKTDRMKRIYKYVGKIDGSEESMYDFLTIYYLENAKSKRPAEDGNKGYYIAEIEDLIEKDSEGVLAIIEDADNYDYKLLVHRGIKSGALVYTTNGIETVDGIPLGRNMKQAISWLKDDKHQDEYLRLKNQVELSK